MTTSQPRSLLLGLTLLLGACGGEGLTLPPDGAAAHIEVLWGDNQSARVGEQLPDSVVVRVTDTQRRPVAGVDVIFEFTTGGSAANPGTSTTDADGTTWSRLVLGTIPGEVTGKAKVTVDAGITPVEVPITAIASPADANGIALVSGDAQTGAVGTQLAAPLVVAVTDQFGNPISGMTVQWSVTGGGSVSSNATVTDATGQTSVTRTLGPVAGTQTTVATAAGLAGSPVPFQHTATAGNAARVIVVDGNGQSAPAGTKLPKQLVVRILDDQDNPISGRAVAWVAGTGSASPETSTTDGNGEARTEWTLGPTPGANTLTAVVSGVGNGAFNATGTKVASTTRITSHSEPSLVGTPVEVGVTVDGSGGTPSGQVTVSGDGAVSSCTITLANGSGSCSITFAQPGNRDLTATYAGDARFSGSSVTVKHQVNPAPVPNTAPTAEFSFSCTNLDCQFTDESNDGDGSVVGWTWDFGDPGSGGQNASTSQSPSHTFTAANTYTVTLTARDDDGATDPHSEQVTVTVPPPPNTPPVAGDDSYTTEVGGSLTVPAPGVLGNDSDDGGVITAVLEGDTANGTLMLNGDGSFTYQANPGATSDSFTYRARDPQGLQSPAANVSITVQ